MKKEEKSDIYLVWDDDDKCYRYRSSKQFEKAKKLNDQIQQFIEAEGGKEAYRKKHIEQMARDLECTPGEYELTEKITDKIFNYFLDFIEQKKELTEDVILSFTSDLELDIVDALKSNRKSV